MDKGSSLPTVLMARGRARGLGDEAVAALGGVSVGTLRILERSDAFKALVYDEQQVLMRKNVN